MVRPINWPRSRETPGCAEKAKPDRCIVSHGSSLTAVRPSACAMPTDPSPTRVTRRPSNHLPRVAPRAELSDKTKYVQVGTEKFSALASQTPSPVGDEGGCQDRKST